MRFLKLPIWEKYIYIEALKFMLFSLLSIYFVYVIIDFSLHSSSILSHIQDSVLDVIIYYGHHFIKRLDIFLPLVLMFTIIKIFCSMNIHKELVALQMAGLSFFRLTRPFFIFALLSSILCLINFQYIVPRSLSFIEKFKTEQFKDIDKINASNSTMNILLLEDGTKLIAYNYNKQEKQLHDVYWIPKTDDFWQLKRFDLSKNPPIGHFVDHFIKRNDELTKTNSYIEHRFSHMTNKVKKSKEKTFLSYENSKISTLVSKLYNNLYSSKQDLAEIQTHLHYKLSISLVSLLVVLFITPFCFHFSRNFKIFFITMFGLFSFVFYYTVMDASIILAENQVVSSAFAIWSPFIVAIALSLIKLSKTSYIFSYK